MHRDTLRHWLLAVVSASEEKTSHLERSSEWRTLISEEWVARVEQELTCLKLQSVRTPAKATNSIQITIRFIKTASGVLKPHQRHAANKGLREGFFWRWRWPLSCFCGTCSCVRKFLTSLSFVRHRLFPLVHSSKGDTSENSDKWVYRSQGKLLIISQQLHHSVEGGVC